MKRPAAVLSTLFCLPWIAVCVQTPPAGFTGVYTHGSVDSVSMVSLAVLPDQTFCLNAVAGALDIQSPGRWEQLGSDQNGIRLKFTRTSAFPSRFVVYSGNPDQTTDTKIAEPELHINAGAFVTLQQNAIFGSGNSPETPDNMAPFFSFDQSSFSMHETLPLKHRYLFFGYPHEEGGWQITRFDIGKPRKHVWINMSEESMSAESSWESRFHNGSLLVERSEMYDSMDLGKPKPLSKKEINEIRKNCLSGPKSAPGFTLIRPQVEYRINSLPDKPAWFGRDGENGGTDAAVGAGEIFDMNEIKEHIVP